MGKQIVQAEKVYYSMLVTLCETGEVSFHLIDTNGFMLRERMKDLQLRVRFVVKTINLKFSCRHLADYVKEMYRNAGSTCNTIIFQYSPIVTSIFLVVVP